MHAHRYSKGPDGTRGFRYHRSVARAPLMRGTVKPPPSTPAERMIRHALGKDAPGAGKGWPPIRGPSWVSVVDSFDAFFQRAAAAKLLSESELDGLTDRIARGETTESALLEEWRDRLLPRDPQGTIHTAQHRHTCALPCAPASTTTTAEPKVVSGPLRATGAAEELDLSGRALGSTLGVVVGSLLTSNPSIGRLGLASLDLGRRWGAPHCCSTRPSSASRR